MQTINYVPIFFLKILPRYCKIAILGTLAMPGHDNQKW